MRRAVLPIGIIKGRMVRAVMLSVFIVMAWTGGSLFGEWMRRPSMMPQRDFRELTTRAAVHADAHNASEAIMARGAADKTVSAPGQCAPGRAYVPRCRACVPTEPDPSITRLHFVRMPQAASGAFTIALRGFFGCSPPDTGCWGDDNRKQLIGADCDGHLPGCFGVTPYVGPMSVTMLRHPLTRVRSAFHHNRAVPYATEEQLIMARRTRTIAEYAAVPGVGNMQTKQMAGLFVSDPAVPTEEQIQRAIAHLDEIAFFGLQEHFDSSVCLFAMRYGGVPPDAAFQRTRVSTNYDPKTPMSADDVEAVLRYDAADVRLYEAALRIFKQRAAALNFELLEV